MSEKFTGDTDMIIRYVMEEKLKNPEVVWDIDEHKEKKMRSLSANSYFYLLCNKIALKQRISDTEVHDKFLSENRIYYENEEGGIDWKVSPVDANAYGLIKEKVGKYYEYYVDSGMSVKLEKETGDKVKYKDGEEVAGHVYWHIKGTHEMTSSELCRVIDSVIFEANQLGIETITPAEKDRLLAMWGEKHDAPKDESKQDTQSC